MTRSSRPELSAPDARFLATLLMESNQPFAAVDLAGRLTHANDAFLGLLGYSREELSALTSADFVTPLWEEEMREAYRKVRETGSPLRYEREYLCKDGSVVPVEVALGLSRDERGEPSGFYAFLTDIRRRREAERALRDSERRARALFEGINDPVIVHSLDGHILDANPAAVRTLGYSRGELLKLTTRDVDDPDFAKEFGHRLERQLAAGSLTVEGRHRTKDGKSIDVDINTAVIQYEGETAVLAVMRDITERNRMRAMLVQSEKLASIGLLSAGIAHEINNPLAYVANNLAILERDFQGVIELVGGYDAIIREAAEADPGLVERRESLLDAADWDYLRGNLPRILGKTREGVQRVANIVHGLRGMARTGDLRMESAHLPDLLVSPGEVIRGRLRKHGIVLEMTAESIPKVPCVPSQISQVALNLLVNAVQAIEGHRASGEGRIGVHIGRRENRPILEVRDNGVGISPERFNKLFDPFFTTKGIGEGTGLGLFICHEIVRAHGGRIEVESEPGEGTTFRVVFAEWRDPRRGPQAQGSEASAP